MSAPFWKTAHFPWVTQLRAMDGTTELTFRSSFLPGRSYDFFRAVKRSDEFCDIILHVGNKPIPAHRLIVAAAIPYFRSTLSSIRPDGKVKVYFPDVHPCIVEILLDYAYSCEVVITVDNVTNLLYGATHLQIEEVRQACCDFLIDRLRPESIFSIRKLASDLKCSELLTYADMSAKENFSVISETEEFLDLPVSYLKDLLDSDELHVKSEEMVFEALMKWVRKCPDQRKENLPELLKRIRMPLVSPVYLKNHVAKEDLIRQDFVCRDLLDEARDFHICPEERPSSSSFSTHPRCQPNIPTRSAELKEENMYLIYGKYVYSAKHLEHPKETWKSKRSTTFRQIGATSAAGNNKMYLLRGWDVISYQPMNNNFEYCELMPSGRYFTGAAQFNNKIYVCGGKNEVSASDIVECYNPERNRWRKTSNMLVCREFPAVAAFGEYIYVAGGRNETSVHKSVEKYNSHTGRWRFVPSMLSERYGLGLAALSGHLYACGGKNFHFDCISTAEVYDPVTNEWKFISPMKCARYCFKLLAYRGKLYAIGGKNYFGENVSTVEIYDPKCDRWNSVNKINCTGLISAEVVNSPPSGHKGKDISSAAGRKRKIQV